MLLSVIFILVAVAATVLVYLGCSCLSPWWILPIGVGFYVAAVLVYVIWLFAAILLTPNRTAPSRRMVRFYHWCEVHTLSWLMILLGIRRKLVGAERIPSDRPFLLVGNHRSAFDPIATLATFKKADLCFVGKPEVFKIPVVGAAMRRVGFFPIDRENPRNAVTAIKRGAELIAQQGRSVAIYPEGTRSKDGALLPFHAGSFKIAKLADCPVVVASVRVKSRWLFPAAVELRIVDVMDAEYVKENNTAAMAERAEAAIREDLGL